MSNQMRATISIADPASPKLILEASHTEGIAPCGFIVRTRCGGFGLAKLDDYFRRIRYKHDAGDLGSSFSRLAANFPWGQGANTSYGPVFAHTYAPTPADFTSAGDDEITYTLTTTATDGNQQISKTATFTVHDPDVIFAGSKTLCVAGSGDTSGALSAYPGCQAFTTVAAAINALDGAQDQRILLERDYSYPEISVNTGNNLQIGAYGTGADPVCDNVVLGSGISGPNVSLWGLEIQGSYDPTVPTSRSVPNGIDVEGKTKSGVYTTIHNCKVGGCSLSITFEGQRMNNVISDCDIGPWYDFAVYQGNAGWTAMIGTTMQQDPATINGSGKYDSDYANHTLRFSRVIDGAPLVMRMCDLASFNDWSVSASKYSVQPCLRLNNGGDADRPELCVTQIRACGAQLGLPATNSYSASPPVKALFDKIYHIKWGQGGRHLGSSFGGARFSNVVTVEADTDWAGGGVLNCGPGGYDGTAGDYASRYLEYLGYPAADTLIKFFQEYAALTVVKLAAGANIDVGANPIDLVETPENVLYPDGAAQSRNPDSIITAGLQIYAPAWSLAPSLDTTDPLTSYPALPLGTHKVGEAVDTDYAVPLSALASYTPTAEDAVVSGEIADMPVDDFFGNIRKGHTLSSDPAGTPTKGAIEYFS